MFEHIKEAIEKSNEILILPHKNADGDCLGSSYALKLALLSLGKKAEVILEPGEDNERICKILYGTEKCDVQNSDLVIAVDCGDLERIGTRGEIFLNCDETISIDHHKTNTKYAKYNLVDSCASAAGELIYELIGVLGATVTKEIASDLYAAIASDSGRFSYSNTTPKTMRIGADLIEKA